MGIMNVYCSLRKFPRGFYEVKGNVTWGIRVSPLKDKISIDKLDSSWKIPIMARPLRLLLKDGIYHVTLRGHEWREILINI